MSIANDGFLANSTLPKNTPVRITITRSSLDLFNQFPAAARVIYDSLLPKAGVAPFSPYTVVSGDHAAIIDGNTKHDMLGSELLNSLDYLEQRFASVTRVQKLTKSDVQTRNTDAGQQQMADAKDKAEQQQHSDSVWTTLQNRLNQLGTVAKWGTIVIGLLALAYLASKLRD